MHYDFSGVDDVDTFASVPEGEYAVKVAEVRDGRARDGSPRWSMRLEVLEGEYAGRTAAWDSLTWSPRGVHRVKQVLLALGFDARGEIDIEPAHLVDRKARVRVDVEEREDPMTGRRQVRMRVPYLGFQPFEQEADQGELVDAWGGEDESCAHERNGGRDGATPF